MLKVYSNRTLSHISFSPSLQSQIDAAMIKLDDVSAGKIRLNHKEIFELKKLLNDIKKEVGHEK